MTTTLSPVKKPIVYPESDGLPMAENTRQFDYITLIKGGLDVVFADRADVFVAGDLFWYPVEGNNKLCTAPDTMVAFGRPKGPRRSYLQWQEDDIAPQVVFEVLSPGNRPAEMQAKFEFYDRYGVEEYYVYDPDHGLLTGSLRDGDHLQRIPNADGWTSPRLGVRMQLKEIDLELFGPDGRRFLNVVELDAAARAAEQNAGELRQRADAERKRADAERQRADVLAAKLRELGVDPASL